MKELIECYNCSTNESDQLCEYCKETMLDELHNLRELELSGNLKNKGRYLEIYEICRENQINIPFGIEI